MKQYIDKSALAAEIEGMLQEEYPCDNSEQTTGYHCALYELQDFLNSLEVKEVDLEKEIELVKGDYEQVDVAWNNDFDFIARHFYELGLQVNNPVTAADRGFAEEIIINLKRVENDYHLDLTREMEWLRNKTMKGE